MTLILKIKILNAFFFAKVIFIVSVFNLRLPCEQHLQIQPGGSSYKAVLLQNGCFEHTFSYKPLLSKTVGFEHKSSIFNLEHQVDTLEELVASDDFSWGIVNDVSRASSAGCLDT